MACAVPSTRRGARNLPDTAVSFWPSLIDAPVGEHRDLLAYLVRRLLENGANSSFAHQLADEMVGAETLLASPLAAATFQALPLPVAPYGPGRGNSTGADLACAAMLSPLQAAVSATKIPTLAMHPRNGVRSPLSPPLPPTPGAHAGRSTGLLHRQPRHSGNGVRSPNSPRKGRPDLRPDPIGS